MKINKKINWVIFSIAIGLSIICWLYLALGLYITLEESFRFYPYIREIGEKGLTLSLAMIIAFILGFISFISWPKYNIKRKVIFGIFSIILLSLFWSLIFGLKEIKESIINWFLMMLFFSIFPVVYFIVGSFLVWSCSRLRK